VIRGFLDIYPNRRLSSASFTGPAVYCANRKVSIEWLQSNNIEPCLDYPWHGGYCFNHRNCVVPRDVSSQFRPGYGDLHHKTLCRISLGYDRPRPVLTLHLIRDASARRAWRNLEGLFKILPIKIDVENRDYHQQCHFEIAGAKRIYQHLPANREANPLPRLVDFTSPEDPPA
jgi:hypothetical protein